MTEKQIRLHLHIGSPKTGSSAIQRFLNINRKELVKTYSCLYPNLNNDDFNEGYMLNHADFFRKAFHEKGIPECIERMVRCFEYCAENKIKNVVISAESWGWEWWPEVMHKAITIGDVDYTIIAYVRRQDKYLESAWKQWGHKMEGCDTIMDYMKKIRLNWFHILSMWTKYFEPEHFIVRPYERSQIGNNIVEDFFRIIGIHDISDLSAPPSLISNANPGFSWEVIELLRYSKGLLSSIEADREHDNKLIYFLNEMIPESHIKKPMDDYAFLSPRQRLEIIDKYAASNRKVARKFLNWQDMDLFSDPLPEPDEAWEPPSDLTFEKAIPIFMQIMLRQHEQIKDLKIQVNKIRRDA